MLFRLLLAFTVIPLVELMLLLRLGAWLGLGPTLGVVLGTGFAGAWLARREGLRAWAAVREELGAGRLPAEELLHALLVLVAGVLLVTPGVLTDLAGLVTLAGPTRSLMVRRIRARLEKRLEVRTVVQGFGPGTERAEEPERRGRVIEI